MRMNTSFKTMSEFKKLANELNEIYYQNMCEEIPPEIDLLETIKEILNNLKKMEDYLFDVTGSYYKREYGNYKLFHLGNMGLLYILLTKKKYLDFLHELSDFILYNVLEDGDNKTDFIPANIKYAIIKTIEEGLKEK